MDGTDRLLSVYGEVVLGIAAGSINEGLRSGAPMSVPRKAYPEALYVPGASFVTLKRNGELRGCVGSAEAHKPLADDVAANAFSAAFRDSRFSRLRAEERTDLTISVSVLSTPVPLECESETGLLQSLRPSIDGLIIDDGGRRALFLPQVWAMLPEPAQFLCQLKLKAGLPADYWSGNLMAWRFEARSISSESLSEPNALWGYANKH